MNENTPFKMHGSMEAVLTKANGDIEVTRKDNIIVAAGFDFICAAIANSVRPAAMGFIAVGANAAPAVLADTALGNQLAIQAATYAHTVGTKVFTVSTTLAAGTGTGAITEAGVFNALDVGAMLDRVVFSVINKGAADTLTLTFTFTLS